MGTTINNSAAVDRAEESSGAASPVAAYLAGLRPTSRVTMASKLKLAARTLAGTDAAEAVDWPAVTRERLTDLRHLLAARYRPSTVVVTLAAVRGVLRACCRLGLMSPDRLAAALLTEPSPRPVNQPLRRLRGDEIAALLDAVLRDKVPARQSRDRCLLACLYGAGLRRSEAVALDLEAVDLGREVLHVPALEAHRPRDIPLAQAVLEALGAWLSCRGGAPGALLLPVLKNGRVGSQRLRPEAVRGILVRVAQSAGVEPLTAEELRRAWFADLAAAGVAPATICVWAGHATGGVTRQYLNRL